MNEIFSESRDAYGVPSPIKAEFSSEDGSHPSPSPFFSPPTSPHRNSRLFFDQFFFFLLLIEDRDRISASPSGEGEEKFFLQNNVDISSVPRGFSAPPLPLHPAGQIEAPRMRRKITVAFSPPFSSPPFFFPCRDLLLFLHPRTFLFPSVPCRGCDALSRNCVRMSFNWPLLSLSPSLFFSAAGAGNQSPLSTWVVRTRHFPAYLFFFLSLPRCR